MPPPKQVFLALKHPPSFKYGLVQGNLDLRNALSKQYKQSNPNNFVITNGASEALDLALRAIGKPKDRILLHLPYYYSYPHLIKLSSLVPIFTETVCGKIQFDDFEKKVHKCKAVLLNSPSNPTGRVQDKKTLKKIENLCRDLGITIISDDVYSSLVYDNPYYSIEGNNVITIQSFSKTYSMCGYRVGYIHSHNASIIKKIVEIKSYSSMNTSTIAQEMAYQATKTPKSFISQQVKIWKERRDAMYEGLMKLGLDVWKPEGAFYVLPKIKNPLKTVLRLYKKHKVITYLGEWFGAPKRIRLSYALSVDKINKGLKRIKKAIN